MTISSAEEQSSITPHKPTDFIRAIINEDLRANKHGGKVITRFPPEPNGFLHIGHAKSICLNFGLARDYHGQCHLRFDDTDPTKEDVSYVNSIQEDVRWLGFGWGENLFYASDYFDKLYDYAVQLIQLGKAYVCSLNETEIREYRGTVTQAGKDSPYRNRSVAENLDLFGRMKAGEFPDGAHVVRAKIDMGNPNMKMRDPLIYRIRHAHHYRAGDKWCIYPLYDFAHCLSDSIERITHSICTLEFENNRELYDWILDTLKVEQPQPRQYEFARLNLNYTVMSKRKLLALVEGGHVSGWDDPRLHTISGLRRRGYTPESLHKFCEAIGIAKANSVVDIAQLEYAIRDDLNQKVPRVLAVLRPLKVTITNYPEGQTEELDSPYYPHDVPKEGVRMVPFSREIYIEQDDYMENPPKDFYRLAPGREVRLRHAYVIRCDEALKDASGTVTELRCTYFPETRSGAGGEDRKVKGTIHWVSVAHAVQTEVRLYDRLFLEEHPSGDPDSLNPHSLEVLKTCYVEPSLAGAEPGSRYQFERQGYFCADAIDSKPGAPVFNRIVTLRDSWTKATKTPEPIAPAKPRTETRKPEGVSEKAASPKLSPEQESRMNHLQEQYAMGEEEARILAEDSAIAAFYEQAVSAHANAAGVANWIINELLCAVKERPLSEIPVTPQTLAELVALLDDATISGKIAKDVFEVMLADGGSPKAIVEAKGLRQITDPAALNPIIDKVIAANPNNVSLYQSGKTSLLGFFVGQVIKETGGKANPKLVSDLVEARLASL